MKDVGVRQSDAMRVPPKGGILQRKCACGTHASGECGECKKKKEGTLQRSATGPATEVPGIVHEVLSSPGRPLDAPTRAFMEPRFGRDFSGVRVHSDAKASESARAVNAHAYTVGQNVVFDRGQYQPGSAAGQRLLAHELTHVAQQNTSHVPGSPLEVGPTDDGFERQAETQAARLHEGAPARAGSSPAGVLQRSAIHQGRILDEGTCEHLACNSKWACEDAANGVKCPEGTRNASPTKKFRPLFTCDTKCENGATCSDSDTWMAIPKSRFTSTKKCGQDLVICSNGSFTHAQVRDRSEKEAWEVSRGIAANLGIGPDFQGAIYSDEQDAAFKTDKRCHAAKPAKDEGVVPPVKTGTVSPGATRTATKGGDSDG